MNTFTVIFGNKENRDNLKDRLATVDMPLGQSSPDVAPA